MYKVLIVDDETLIRKSIEFSIDYNTLPLTVCGLAKMDWKLPSLS